MVGWNAAGSLVSSGSSECSSVFQVIVSKRLSERYERTIGVRWDASERCAGRPLGNPNEVIERQVSLPVKAIGHEGAAVAGTVVNTDDPVGL